MDGAKCINDKCDYIGVMHIRESGPHKGPYCPKCNRWQGIWFPKKYTGQTEEYKMSFNFSVNHNEAFDNSIIAEGTYEVIVREAKEKYTNTGTQHISIQLAVRNDIDQKSKNKVIFETVWKAKATGEYNMGQLQTIAKAFNIKNGTEYTCLDDVLKDFSLRTARVTVKHEEYNGNTNARVKKWEPTNFMTCAHTWKEPVQSTDAQPQTEEWVPF